MTKYYNEKILTCKTAFQINENFQILADKKISDNIFLSDIFLFEIQPIKSKIKIFILPEFAFLNGEKYYSTENFLYTDVQIHATNLNTYYFESLNNNIYTVYNSKRNEIRNFLNLIVKVVKIDKDIFTNNELHLLHDYLKYDFTNDAIINSRNIVLNLNSMPLYSTLVYDSMNTDLTILFEINDYSEFQTVDTNLIRDLQVMNKKCGYFKNGVYHLNFIKNALLENADYVKIGKFIFALSVYPIINLTAFDENNRNFQTYLKMFCEQQI